MDFVKKLPFKHLIGSTVRFLDRHGWMPASMIATDPYYCSVVLTNLGSLKLDAGYHHMTNWGTNSLFCAIGLMKKRPFYDDNGNTDMRMSVDLGMTIDERIADGYYYATEDIVNILDAAGPTYADVTRFIMAHSQIGSTDNRKRNIL